MTDVTHEHHAAAVERESFSRRRYPFAVGLHRARDGLAALGDAFDKLAAHRSAEHTSELQSLMRISYAVICLQKKKPTNDNLIDSRHHNDQQSNKPEIMTMRAKQNRT